MRHLLTTLLLLLATAAAGQTADMERRYREIDEAIAASPTFVAQREAKIAVARRAFEQSSGSQKFDEGYRLFELYRPFVSDSAIYFLRQCIRLAEAAGDHSASVRCRSQLAIRCSNIGLYDEALNILDSIRLSGNEENLAVGTYYEAYNNVYSELSYYTRLDDMRKMYQQKVQQYEELMFRHLPPASESCLMRREQKAQAEGRLKESMRITTSGSRRWSPAHIPTPWWPFTDI